MKNRNIIFKMKKSKVTDYAALIDVQIIQFLYDNVLKIIFIVVLEHFLHNLWVLSGKNALKSCKQSYRKKPIWQIEGLSKYCKDTLSLL